MQSFETLNLQARMAGFRLACRDVIKSGFCRYYCTKGGRIRGNKTNKVNCPFCFRTIVNDDGEVTIELSGSVLEHNHDLLPKIYSSSILTKDQRNIILNMLKSNIKPFEIRNFLVNQGISNMSTFQIRMIQVTETSDENLTETEELKEYIHSQNGIVKSFDIPYEGKLERLAIITMTPDEITNLKLFGDTLFIDGTQINLKLRWDTIPITVIDRNKNIQSAGIIYSSILTEDVINWILESLIELDFMKSKLETIITDEDAAFLVAFDRFIVKNQDNLKNNVKHVLCSLHKAQNFKKKVNSLGLPDSIKEMCYKLFETICYCPNYDYVMSCLGKLYDIEQLVYYLDKEILPILHMFSRSCLNNTHCLGYNVTSPAESMNNMLKKNLPDRSLTLLESRIEFNSTLQNHKLLLQENLNRRRITLNDNIFEKYFMPNITKEIEFQIRKSHKVILVVEENEYYTHKAFTEDYPDQYYHLNEWECSCGLATFAGIPCCHLIALHQNEMSSFPSFLIDPRWGVISDEIEMGGFNNDEATFVDESDQQPSFEESNPLISIQLMQETHGINQLRNLSEGQRYVKLVNIAKQICSIVSPDLEKSGIILTDFSQRLEELRRIRANGNFENREDLEIVDHIDAKGRPRGRPPKLRKCYEHTKAVKCLICDKNHQISDCPFYGELQDLLKNEPIDIPGKHKCGLCRQHGHNLRNCPLKIKATGA